MPTELVGELWVGRLDGTFVSPTLATVLPADRAFDGLRGGRTGCAAGDLVQTFRNGTTHLWEKPQVVVQR